MLTTRLKALRKKVGITQEQLAAAIGVERSSVGKYESPTKPVQPSSEVLLKLASYFDVTTDYLLGLDTKKESTADMGELSQNAILFDSILKDANLDLTIMSAERRKQIADILKTFGNK